ncbi:MAG: glycosyltransferase family 39 protein [Proteobacteria bacterium]|nr:glycosyltransferase family 39 protein [Pseudomonadota bacterium]
MKSGEYHHTSQKIGYRYFGIISLVSAISTLWLESQAKTPRLIIFIFPIIGLLIIYNVFVLLGGYEKVTTFLFSLKGIISLTCFLLLTGLCCTPANQWGLLTRYLTLSPNPFRNYHWLSVSFVGILFSLSFLNYTLGHTDGFPVHITQICRIIWRLPQKYFLLLFSSLVFILANLFSWTVFEHIPHVQDEIAQLFQTKIFASGHVTAPLPPIADFFRYRFDNMIFSDRWYSEYPPGHPFLLMIGVITEMPWIINPLLASLSCILLYNIILQSYGEREARLSVILFSTSTFVLFMSASFMNHVSTLFFLLLFLYTLDKSQREEGNLYALAAGLSLGTMLNIRPPDALIIGMLYGFFFFVWSLSKKIFRPFIYFSCAVVMMGGILLLYNYVTNGDPLLFGYQVCWGDKHSFGFFSVPIMDRPPHTPLRGLMNTLSNLITLNENLFEWPFPSLIPLIIFWTPFLFKKDRQDYVLLCGLLAAPVLYFFYFFQDLCLGPRFYYISLPFVLALTAKALFQIMEKIAFSRHCSERSVKNAFIGLLLCSLAFSGLVRLPQLSRFYSNSFWEVDDKLMKKTLQMGITNALIFQKSEDNPYQGMNLGSGFLYNSPGLNDSIVFARDLGKRNSELLPFSPGRNYYVSSKDERGEIRIEPLDIHTFSGNVRSHKGGR